MTALPLKTSISDTYPNPSNATARAGFAQLWDAINETLEKPELDIASGTTCDIGGQLSTKLRITGATTITSFGTNFRGPIHIRVAAALTITHNSTTLICPGSTSITTTAGDVFIAWPKATSGAADGWLIAKVSSPVLGVGQTWQNMAASRAINTTYTNSTGRPIVIAVSASLSTVNSTLWVNVNGSPIGFSSGNYAVNGWCAAQPVLVPSGATYSTTINGGGSASSLSWLELR